MIALNNVTKIYPITRENRVSAVREVSLTIENGEFVTIVGRSGSGKTTLLNLIAGLTHPTSGQVLFDGRELWKLDDVQQSQMRSQYLGFVFQFPSLIPTLTVFENMVLPSMFGKTPTNKSEVAKEALELLQRVGLAEKRDVYPRQISAGQQQRVVIARALINHPKILLADEPTSNLDEKTELEIMDLFRDLHQNLGFTIVMVTHIRQLVRYSTRTIEMSEGQIREN